jgi:asparagine synthase (glutamine-hydrolysing)
MCGIAGFLNLDQRPADPDVLARMTGIQRHRGPDDQGHRLFSLQSGKSVEYLPGGSRQTSLEGGLGFNRLSILDLSRNGHQPMTNADASVILAFNGEVYNANEYRPELQRAGYRFRSGTDTEVLLYLYEHYGLTGMLERANGMFAIVIVDLKTRALSIARDHLGIKPFYWAVAGQTLLFASEVKSFLVHPAFRAELDQDNVDEYLAFRYCAGERHLLRGVNQLRPGHLLQVVNGTIGLKRYWEIPDQREKVTISFSEAVDQFDALLQKSVKSQLLSDVKVGCQLSGGIDSSVVTKVARMHGDADMDSFSIIFRDPAFSEEAWITQAARVADVDSHRYHFSEGSFFDNFERACWHLDQPLNHPNSLGIYLLAEKASKLVTVLLSGEGADELLGGYPRFYHAALRPRCEPWRPVLGWVPGIGPKFTRLFGDGTVSPVDLFLLEECFQDPEQMRQVRPEFGLERVLEGRRSMFLEGRGDHVDNCLKYDMQTYMADLLVRQDKMTMAHSMENRVPFLDRELVSFVRSLPIEYLVGSRIYRRDTRMRNTKKILKELAGRFFDPSFVHRRKSGFALPLASYFGQPRFRELMHDRLLPGIRARGVFKPETIERWWHQVSNDGRPVHEALWIAVSFELWAQRTLDHSHAHWSGTIESGVPA